jgi:plasmid stability protein
LIRGLDEEIIKRLKDRARRHARSLQGEIKPILAQAASKSLSEARQLARQWHQKLAGQELPDSIDLLHEDRQR